MPMFHHVQYFLIEQRKHFRVRPGRRKLDRPANLPFSDLDCAKASLRFRADRPFRRRICSTNKLPLKFNKNNVQCTNLKNNILLYNYYNVIFSVKAYHVNNLQSHIHSKYRVLSTRVFTNHIMKSGSINN